ncbi:MAG: transketolase C-terminal domain-containing protein, partial [Lentimicrobiaceae bacterium]|nr:transketolase C-terminal domain-containing protein [Lentimicrobiaceae bacterium]
FQSTKGGGHGDYRMIVLAPSSVQEMADFAALGFDLAFKYRNPVMVLSDGAIGQMMEKVELDQQVPRLTEAEIIANTPWATTGKTKDRERNIITSLDLDSAKMELHNIHLQKKYREIEANETRYETIQCEDADYLIVAYGTSARISQKAVDLLRAEGIKAGLLRPITLFPFPSKPIAELANKVKGILVVEMSAGQMIEDVRLAVGCKVKAEHFGRMGGIIPSPTQVVEAMHQKIIGG